MRLSALHISNELLRIIHELAYFATQNDKPGQVIGTYWKAPTIIVQ